MQSVLLVLETESSSKPGVGWHSRGGDKGITIILGYAATSMSVCVT